MASKQIMISQYDYGHRFQIKALKGNGEELPLKDVRVELSLVKPDNTCITIDKKHYSVFELMNLITFKLPAEYTEEPGLYTIFVAAISDDYKYTSETSVSYFVTERHNGANCTH